MTSPQTEADNDLEITDSGHQVSTKRTEEGVEEFWAVVENSRDDQTVTVELQLHDEEDVLARHERTQNVKAGDSERYRFVVPILPGFDQYVFTIADRDDADGH